MIVLVLGPNRPTPGRLVRTNRAMPRPDEHGPSRVERIVDFALCLILAIAVIGLLLLAL